MGLIKFKLPILVAILATSIFCDGQSIVELNYHNDQLLALSGKRGDGNIFPISEQVSAMNIENAHLMLINHVQGSVIKELDEHIMEKALDTFLLQKTAGDVRRYNEEERKYLPYCSSNQFQYHRFYRVGNELACQMDIPLKKKGIDEQILHHFVVYFDNELHITDIYFRDKVEGPSLFSISEGFFLNKDHYYVGKNNPTPNDQPNFVHFERKNHHYQYIDELIHIPEIEILNYFTGRHLTAVPSRDLIYINNGKSIFKLSNDLNNCYAETPWDISEDELVADLKPINDSTFVGLKIKVDAFGTPSSPYDIYFFSTDETFQTLKPIKKYNALDFTINSLETLDGKSYLYLYDRKKKKYLIDCIPITP